MFTQDYFEKHFKLHNKIVLYTPDDIKLEFTKEPHFHMSGGHTSLDLMDMEDVNNLVVVRHQHEYTSMNQ